MKNKQLALELIKYFERRNLDVTDGYEWREINGFILQLKHNFDITDNEYIEIYKQINKDRTKCDFSVINNQLFNEE